MKNLTLLFSSLFFATALAAQIEIPLYPGAIPNNSVENDQGKSLKRDPGSGLAYFDTTHPSLSIYKPAAPNGKAIIVCPGGGYARTAFEKEGTRVADRLLRDSITVFVLKYRLPNPEFQLEPSLAPLQDAQTAIKYVREQAKTYQLNTNQIGIMGFSAGGHLAATAATKFLPDRASSRPDFAILIYPVISMTTELTHSGSRERLIGKNPDEREVRAWSADQQVSPDTPPTFLVHAGDDKSVPVGNSLAYYQACINNGVAVEMHLYPGGGHGFGLYNKTTADDWTERLTHWLQNLD
jgi:acetyl esterase/lipase